jgi:pyrroloquinoline quinone biosynthesis protein B
LPPILFSQNEFTMLRVLVLGSAAGGGFPQWNCNCRICQRARAQAPDVAPRSQSSLAVTANGDHWFLLNASPDLRQQINDNAALHPHHGLRHSPIAGVVLTNGDIDHVAGLLTLRESTPLAIYATARVHAALGRNSVFNVLNPDFVERRKAVLGQPFELTTRDGVSSGVLVEMFAVPGKVALYLEDANAGPDFGTMPGDTVGLRVESVESGEYFFYIPGCAAMTDDLAKRVTRAPLVLFDGTLWHDDEMIDAGIGVKTGKRMGHISITGAAGSIAAFENLRVPRKVFIHINNSNPILLDDSPERSAVAAAGWEVAFDGMEFRL